MGGSTVLLSGSEFCGLGGWVTPDLGLLWSVSCFKIPMHRDGDMGKKWGGEWRANKIRLPETENLMRQDGRAVGWWNWREG